MRPAPAVGRHLIHHDIRRRFLCRQRGRVRGGRRSAVGRRRDGEGGRPRRRVERGLAVRVAVDGQRLGRHGGAAAGRGRAAATAAAPVRFGTFKEALMNF